MDVGGHGEGEVGVAEHLSAVAAGVEDYVVRNQEEGEEFSAATQLGPVIRRSPADSSTWPALALASQPLGKLKKCPGFQLSTAS